ncbi:NADH dehydrogenase subunit J [Anaerolinea thermolimosa]|uniref:NADH-quinone oxidoreductase subunit J family protein n=1 Tax=Anaerolinea thermolimosa TaxID=229919 RepID=UPI00078102CF|nr:NADH-quinone oxidoreductase subunit J [Anaerolinea thermolimosa]GAP05814.1 NADH dehydrogenase subunit J [Anaerolinea thermolimosa]
MTGLQIAFLAIAAVTLASAVLVVSSRKIMHAALWLVLALGGIAALFATLEASFFAAVQVMVYIGAIAILIIFSVMLTRRVMEDTGPQNTRYWPAALVVSLGVFGGILFLFLQWPGFSVESRPGLEQGDLLVRFGQALVSPDEFVVPFEVASILLVAAMIGAMIIARDPSRK